MSAVDVPGFRGGREARGRLRFIVLLAAATAFLLLEGAGGALAQGPPPSPTPPTQGTGNANIAASNAVFDLGTQFFTSLSRHSSMRADFGSPNATPGGTSIAALPGSNVLAYGTDSGKPTASVNDPLAAYAAAAAPASPRYRSWFEGYGSVSHTDAQGTFTGDRRKSFGGIAGIGATLVPGVSIGGSIDQGRTKIDVTGGAQSSRIDMTQLGLNVAFESGPWTWSVGGIRGFGTIHSSRIDTGGEATASYHAYMWGALTELSYYWSSGSWRVVPKLGLDWSNISLNGFTESGGAVPVSSGPSSSERTRLSGALELGYTTRAGTTLYDIGVYGKVIDILAQDVPALTATPLNGAAARTIPGVTDALVEYATGATLSVRLPSLTRLYAAYDGRFRSGFDSHAGTIGAEFRW